MAVSELLSKKTNILALTFLILTWSANWSVNKTGLQFAPPLLYAAMRPLVAALFFLTFLWPQWRAIEWRKNWVIYVMIAVFNIFILIGLQQTGLQYLPSGLFSVVTYLQPVFIVLFAWLMLKETLTPRKIIGMIIGFSGVLVVSLESITGNISMIGIVLAILSGTSWAFGVVYMKKTSANVHPLWLVTIQNFIGGILLLIIALSAEDVSAIQWNWPFLACISYSGFLAQGVATVVYFKLINTGDASKVGSFTFLIPLIAVAIGTFILGEPFNLSLLTGLILVLASIFMINRKS
jgi:drug/metabolite transporter (DMT)-like permease